jgi:hypothetical protein
VLALQAEAQKQLEEQQEKQARALKAVQRAQKLLATHVSMAQQRPASGSTQQRPGSGANSGVSSGSSTYREAASAGADGQAVVADAAELEADVQLTQLRLVMRGMLQELRMLDVQNPGAAAGHCGAHQGCLLGAMLADRWNGVPLSCRLCKQGTNLLATC